jgi:hypothetical protein
MAAAARSAGQNFIEDIQTSFIVVMFAAQGDAIAAAR